MGQATFYQLLVLSFIKPKDPLPVSATKVCIAQLGYLPTVRAAERESAIRDISMVKEDIYPSHMISDKALAEWFWEEDQGRDRDRVWAIIRPVKVYISGERRYTKYFPISYKGPEFGQEIHLGIRLSDLPTMIVIIDIGELPMPGHPNILRRAAWRGALGI